MSTIGIRIFLLFVLLNLVACSSLPPEASLEPSTPSEDVKDAVNGLTVSLATDKYAYQENESIRLFLELKNVTSAPISFPKLNDRYFNTVGNPFEVLVMDKGKNRIGSGVSLTIGRKNPMDNVILPGRSLRLEGLVEGYFDENVYRDGQLSAGTYFLTVICKVEPHEEDFIWSGKLVSNRVEVAVLGKQGD